MPICSVCKAGYNQSVEDACPCCGASLVAQKRHRKIVSVLRTWWFPALLAWGLLSVARPQIKAGLDTCAWLDRRIGRSGCIAKVSFYETSLDNTSIEGLTAVNTFGAKFSPDEQTLALPAGVMLTKSDRRRADGSAVVLLDVASGGINRVLVADETRPAQMTNRYEGLALFSTDGELLVNSIPQGDTEVVYLWNSTTGDRLWRRRMRNCQDLAFSTDNQFILCSDRRIAIDSGEVKLLREADELTLTAVAAERSGSVLERSSVVSPDQSLKARITSANKVVIHPASGRYEEPQAELFSNNWNLTHLQFSADSQQLIATAHFYDTISIWQRENGGYFEELVLGTEVGLMPAWSDSGKLIAINSAEDVGTLLIFAVDDMKRCMGKGGPILEETLCNF